MVCQVDTQLPHSFRNGAVDTPAPEYSASIGPEGNNVAQRLEFWERFIYFNLMALSVALYSCCESSEACSDDYYIDASFRLCKWFCR